MSLSPSLIGTCPLLLEQCLGYIYSRFKFILFNSYFKTCQGCDLLSLTSGSTDCDIGPCTVV